MKIKDIAALIEQNRDTFAGVRMDDQFTSTVESSDDRLWFWFGDTVRSFGFEDEVSLSDDGTLIFCGDDCFTLLSIMVIK